MKKDCWTVLWYFSIMVEFGTWKSYLKLCKERDAIAHQRGERDAIAHQRGVTPQAAMPTKSGKIARTNF
jgi:hypothetical protein